MPLRETAYQGYTFLALVYAGILSALLFDLLRPFGASPPLRVCADALACMISALLCFAALAITDCGELRLYMLFALLTGAALYRAGVRSVLMKIINIAAKTGKRLRRKNK